MDPHYMDHRNVGIRTTWTGRSSRIQGCIHGFSSVQHVLHILVPYGDVRRSRPSFAIAITRNLEGLALGLGRAPPLRGTFATDLFVEDRRIAKRNTLSLRGLIAALNPTRPAPGHPLRRGHLFHYSQFPSDRKLSGNPRVSRKVQALIIIRL